MVNFENILKKEVSKWFGDSGAVYGYQYEKNRENGILKGSQICDYYRDDEDKECELTPIVPIYDFLEYNCIDTFICNDIQQMIEDRLEEENIDIYSIWEVEDIIKDMFNNNGFIEIEWNYTYNYDNVLSQDIQFLTFEHDGLDYVLLQVHNGCDARCGLTRPQVFELNDIEYFLMGITDCNIYCDCDKMTLDYYDYNEIINGYSGEYVDNQYIYQNTYVDDDDNLRCKYCDAIIKCCFVEY